MKITKKQNGTALEVAVEGRLDTVTAPEFEKEIMESIKGIDTLTLDFANLEYISSAGLRVLMMAHRNLRLHGTTKVIHCNDIVREVFEVTGFGDILTIE